MPCRHHQDTSAHAWPRWGLCASGGVVGVVVPGLVLPDDPGLVPEVVLPEDGVVVPVFVLVEGGVPEPLEDCDGSGSVALDPEPPQPASAVMTSATQRVRRGDPDRG